MIWFQKQAGSTLFKKIRKQTRCKRSPHYLWFNGNAEEAVNFYTYVFKNSKVGGVSRFGDSVPGPEGAAMVATFHLDGQEFMALNRGPHFKYTEAISLLVSCENQDEVYEYWKKLSEGGQKITMRLA